MKKLCYSFILSFGLLFTLVAQEDAYHIKIKVDGYDQDFLTIANNLLDKQYVLDTLYRAEDGYFHLRDTSELPKGIYLAVRAPSNDYFQFLVGNEPPFFTLETSIAELGKVTSDKSIENQQFYEYLGFLDGQRLKDAPLREKLNQPGISEEEKEQIKIQRLAINNEVEAYQQRLVEEKAASFVAAIIKSNMPVIPPGFRDQPEEDRQVLQWRYTQEHYFDNIDLKDERLLRTPFLFKKIDYYVHKLYVQHPDTIALAIDKVLEKMDEEAELFKMYLIHFLNEAANSEIVGMDAIYVHLIDHYYAKGKAPWTEEEQLKKFIDNAERLRPLLIGKKAPDIRMQKRDDSFVNLYDVDTDYTILYFWRYDCSHCKKSTPAMKEFYDKWKDKNVTLFAVCAKVNKDIPPCWEYIDDNEINDWLHTVDPYMRSRYGKLYDVQSTPSIFVLDKDKTIISKRIGAEQLDDLMTRIMEQKSREAAEEESKSEE